ncbi:MAG: hypothetical protein ACYCSF_02010 [Acidimicrobiales bacterium]
MRSRRTAFTLLVLGLLLASCTSVRNGLGTRDGICFSALPAARQDVGRAVLFAGVRYLSTTYLEASLERPGHGRVSLPPALRALAGKGTCLVAFRGKLPARVAARAWHRGRGPYRFAVVIVRQSDHRVLGVLMLARPPLGFTHLS